MTSMKEHLKIALGDTANYNTFQMGKASRLLGDIGYKNNEIIEGFFKKLEVCV